MEYTGVSVGTRNAIIVESANSKLLLCQLNESNITTLVFIFVYRTIGSNNSY